MKNKYKIGNKDLEVMVAENKLKVDVKAREKKN